MQNLPKLAIAALVLTTGMAPTVYAQEDGRAFAVTYIEVTPSSTERTVELLREQARASQAEAGNLRYQILQRTGRPNHFAILDAWESQAARDKSLAARHTRTFRTALEPLLYSPYDERPSTPVMGTAGAGGEGEVYAITHVDLIPTGLEEGTALIKAFIDASRRDPGAVEIGIMPQNSRRNHFTLFETWSSAEHRIAHASTAHARHFRNELLTRSGSVYDERLYRRL